MTTRKQAGLAAAFVLWMAFVLTTFYAVQKPLSASSLASLQAASEAFVSSPSLGGITDSILNILAAAALGLAALLAGSRLSPLPYPGGATLDARVEYWLFGVLLGFLALALLTFALSLLGLLIPLALAVFALLLLWLSHPRTVLARWLGDVGELSTVKLNPLVVLFLVISIALALLAALSPPTAWDALVYHLTVPLRALENGRLAPTGDIIPHEDFPLLMSALYLLAMFVKGDIAAQLLHFLFGLLTLGFIALTALKVYGRQTVPVALVLALSMPMLPLLSSWAYNDVALACYTLAAVYAYQRWHDTADRHYLLLSALMSGSALALKYTSFVVPVGILVMAFYDLRSRRLRRPLAMYAGAVALVALPWYLKNLVFTGNPVYPFVFGGAGWDAMRSAWYARGGSGIGLDPLALLTLPIVATLGIRDANYYDGRIGPLVVMLAPLLILNRPRIDRFVFMFLLQFAFWVVGVIVSASLWQTRLLLPALVLLVPPLAAVLCALGQFDRPSFSLRRIAVVVVALVLSLTLVAQTVDTFDLNPLAYVLGAESREHFVVRNLGLHADAMLALNRLPPAARVQFMWEPRSYLAAVSVRADPLLDALPHLVATSGSLAAGVQRLKRDGFTHVFVYEKGARFAFANLSDEFSADDARDLSSLESDYARIVFENEGYRLLELK